MSKPIAPLILIVEDEVAQVELLTYNLVSEGFQLSFAENGEEALLLADELQPDLIILDWMLPKVSGIEVCRQLKKQRRTRKIPIIMLTAKGEEADRIRGLETGADDYIVKPYSVNEVVARSRAVLRRSRPASVDVILSYSDIELDPEKHKVTRNGKSLKLGPTEYRLLVTFMETPGRVWSREQLLDRAWGRDTDIDLRTVDVHVGRLRKALGKAGASDPIRTVRGAGYSLDIED